MSERRGSTCSFCRKGEADVAKLVAGPKLFFLAGPRLYICDRCVALAGEIMSGGPSEAPPAPQPQRNIVRRALDRIVRRTPRPFERHAVAR